MLIDGKSHMNFSSIVLWMDHLGDVKMDNVMIDDVMIGATSHWLLVAMWYAKLPITIVMLLAKSENTASPKKHETQFYPWNGIFQAFRQIWYHTQDGIHASVHHLSNSVTLIPFEKYRHRLFTICIIFFFFFNFLLELSKMYWFGNLARAEQGSVR